MSVVAADAMPPAGEAAALEAATGSGAECQPTRSTSGFWADLLTFNLTRHVEHHDLPMVPWSRLPE
eukprot:1990591-Prymnesium_polylepis.1